MSESATIRFEGFELDPRARSLLRDGRRIPLTPKSFDLLLYLAEHPHQVVSKDRLLSAIWPDSFVEESNLSQHVFLLRKALATSGRADRIVVTIPGKGYQFVAAIEATPPAVLQRTSSHPGAASSGGLLVHAVRSVTSVVIEEEEDSAEEGDTDRASARSLPAPQTGGKPHRRWFVWSAVAATLLMCVILWRMSHPSPVGHVGVVLAELENATHDADFDRTLNRALEIDLEQSPYLSLLSPSAIGETLKAMQRPAGTPLLPALAREVCERNNAEVVLTGTLSQLGSRYLLMLEADSCVSGKQVAGSKAEASSKEGVLSALDSAAGHLRRQLGESSASLDRFQTPVAQATTSSLEALRAYTQGSESFERGDMKAAQNSLERAIALDPKFASAYRSLGSTFYERCDNAQAAQYFAKAYELRELTTERERLAIEIFYFGYGLNDSEEAIRRTRQFLEVYPNDSGSWGWTNLANIYVQLGEYTQAIDAGEHAMRLDPHSAAAAQVLARAYKQANRFSDAKRVADASIAEGKDLWLTHSILFHIAYAEGDQARIESEGQWGLTHLNSNMTLDDLGLAAATGGKLREALRDFTRARDESLRIGDREYADGVLLDEASVLAELGQPNEAAKILRQIQAPVGDSGDVVFYRAMAGDTAPAQKFIADTKSTAERDTVKVFVDLPLVKALLALEAHKPIESVQLLEPANPYLWRDYRVPYLRAQAETEAGMLDAAAEDYRLILRHQGVDPIAPVYSLSHLRLARVLARQKKLESAKAEYKAFLGAWRDADYDLPLLVQAREENTRLLSPR